MKHYLLCIGLLMVINKVAIVPPSLDPPKNVILLIGNGLGLSQISLNMHLNNGQSTLMQFPITGLQIPSNLSNIIPEPAASATAIACGTKTYHGAIGLDKDSNQVNSFAHRATRENLLTGLVTTSNMFDPNIAAFFSHLSWKDSLLIPTQLPNSGIDLYIGGGKYFFDPPLVEKATNRDYQIDYYTDDFLVDKDKSKWLLFTADLQPERANNDRTYFPESIQDASNYLSKHNKQGFVLVGSAAQMSTSAQLNNIEDLKGEIEDFEKAIASALAFAKQDGETLLIVTAGVESGGLAINPGSTVEALITEFTTTGHTGTFLPVFAYGPSANEFSGTYKNTAIHDKILKVMGWE